VRKAQRLAAAEAVDGSLRYAACESLEEALLPAILYKLTRGNLASLKSRSSRKVMPYRFDWQM
jgi:hypothetical protein